MSLWKNSKLWSRVGLAASLVCVAAMLYCVYAARAEHISFREASSQLRTLVQLSLAVLAFCSVIFVLTLRDTSAAIVAAISIAVVLTPLFTIKANMPAGTAVFSATPPGPPSNSEMAGTTNNSNGMASQPTRVPPINDISTDTHNPPEFSAVVALRPSNSNSIDYAGAKLAAAQAKQYPDIKPIKSPLSKAAAFVRAHEVAKEMGWDIVAKDLNTGRIEAVATTFFFNFKDDVVIRVSANDESNTIIDIRSHSRIGRGDRGKNADRVRTFIDTFSNF